MCSSSLAPVIRSTYLNSEDLVIHKCCGLTTGEDLVNAALDWEQSPAFKRTTSSIWDLTGSEFQLDWAKFKSRGLAIARHLEEYRHPSAKTAWVVSDSIQEMIFENLHAALPWPTEWRVFPDLESAMDWTAKLD